MTEQKNHPEKRRWAKMKTKIASQKRQVIKDTVAESHRKAEPVLTASQISDRVKELFDLQVSQTLVRKVLKEDLKLSSLKTKKLNPSANSDVNLVKRQ